MVKYCSLISTSFILYQIIRYGRNKMHSKPDQLLSQICTHLFFSSFLSQLIRSSLHCARFTYLINSDSRPLLFYRFPFQNTFFLYFLVDMSREILKEDEKERRKPMRIKIVQTFFISLFITFVRRLMKTFLFLYSRKKMMLTVKIQYLLGTRAKNLIIT